MVDKVRDPTYSEVYHVRVLGGVGKVFGLKGLFLKSSSWNDRWVMTTNHQKFSRTNEQIQGP